MQKKILLIGLVAMDVRAFLEETSSANNEPESRIHPALGGVIGNMAGDFARMGCRIAMLTAIGTDVFGNYIIDRLRTFGISSHSIMKHPTRKTAIYVAMLNKLGEVETDVFDGHLREQVSVAYLKKHTPLFAEADLIVTDLDVPEESLAFISQMALQHKKMLFMNATSPFLAERFLRFINQVHVAGMNQAEAEKITGKQIVTPEDAILVGKSLLLQGVHSVIITLGGKGAIYCDVQESIFEPALPAAIVDTTGAGDALYAGFLFRRLNGFAAKDCLTFGLAAASLTIESKDSILPPSSTGLIEKRLKKAQRPFSAP
jgi:pseudouridine kinase